MNFGEIERIVAVLQESSLTEIEVRQGERVLRLRRPSPRRAAATAAPMGSNGAAGVSSASAAGAGVTGPALLPVSRDTSLTVRRGEQEAPAAATTLLVRSSLVGVFHPLTDPLGPGDVVAAGQILGYIESMRLMNECFAPGAGQVQTVLAEEGQPIEYGQPLFELTPVEISEVIL